MTRVNQRFLARRWTEDPMASALQPIRIKLSGELDIASQRDLEQLLAPAESAEAAIIDLENVLYLDSTAIACFIRLKKHMVEDGHAGIVRIENANARIYRLLKLCSLDTLFDVQAPDNGHVNAELR
jgi:anti-anti-sigma factor